MSKPLVSVIIPAYNAANYINDCLFSIQNQTYSNLQIIVVNDGSNDNTIELVTKIAESDERIVLINQDNKGCSAAKNKGLQYFKGDFVQYIDADDMLSNDKIENQVHALENNRDCIALCKTVIFKNHIADTNEEIDTDLISKEGTGKDFLLRLWGSEGRIGMVQPNAFLVPKEIIYSIGIWDEALSYSPAEDGEYFSRVLLASKKVIYTTGINYYRKLPNVMSVSKGNTFQNAESLFLTIKKSFQHLLRIENNKEILGYYSIQLTSCAYRFGNEYPEIFTLVENEFLKHNIKKYKLIGNNRFVIVANILGFKNVMKLRKNIKQNKYINFS